MKRLIPVVVLMFVVAVMLSSCDENPSEPKHDNPFDSAYVGEGGSNLPPYAPSDPDPFDGEPNVSVNTILQWSCTDPENDIIKYDIFLGTSSDPDLYDHDIAGRRYSPFTLLRSTTYYWKIVARDSKGAKRTGPIWSFTTGSDVTNDNIDTLIYDPDMYDFGWYNLGGNIANRMSPNGQCQVLKLGYYFEVYNSPIYQAELYSVDGDGIPNILLHSQTASAVSWEWNYVDISSENIDVNSDFCVSFTSFSVNDTLNVKSYNNSGNGRGYYTADGDWYQWDDVTLLIRAVVEYPDGTVTTISPSEPIKPVEANETKFNSHKSSENRPVRLTNSGNEGRK